MNHQLREWLLDAIPPGLLRLKRQLFPPHRPVKPPITQAEQAYRALQRGVPVGQIELRPGMRFRIHPLSQLPFEAFCFRAPGMPEELDSFISETRGRRRLLDIGALHGIFSLVFVRLNPGATVLAMDPSPFAFSTLLYNLQANGEKEITPLNIALTNHPGKIPMGFEDEHAIVLAEGDKAMGAAAWEADARTGDEVCAERTFDPDTIKIDVEGAELSVLQGLRATIQKFRPLIFIEIHPKRIANLGHSVADLVDFFRDHGYTIHAPGGVEQPLTDLLKSSNDSRWVAQPAPDLL